MKKFLVDFMVALAEMNIHHYGEHAFGSVEVFGLEVYWATVALAIVFLLYLALNFFSKKQ